MEMIAVMSLPTQPDALAQLADLARNERAALVAVAVREGLRADEALECVQDALCTWLVRMQREQETSPSAEQSSRTVAGLKLTVRNAARNRRRLHRLHLPHRSLDAAPELDAGAQDAEQLLSAAETSLRLKTCVAELREVERAVITLRLLEERSGEDVAQALGLARSHVDVLVHRAKLTLRTCMRAANCPGT